MAVSLNRRQVVAGGLAAGAAMLAWRGATSSAGLSLPGIALGPSRPFSFESLAAEARAPALQPWRTAQAVAPDLLDRIDYDAYQKIRYRKARSLQIDRNGRTPVQLFHLGRYFKEPVRIGVVDAGEAREVLYRPELFEIPVGHVARELPEGAGFAGFRVMT